MTNELARTNPNALAAPTQQNAPDGAALALAEQVRAGVEARALVAMRRPRNEDQVRQDLLRDCKRPHFAERAIYSVPISGSNVTGPSIRFAEACVRAMGNLDVDVLPLYDGPDAVKLLVAAVDLEKNTRVTATVDVPKTVIRKRKPKDPKSVIETRVNSFGDLTYVVRADEQAMRPKVQAEISKAMRTCVLRLVPGWLVDEALEQIDKTIRNAAAEDPDAYRRRVVDAFDGLGVRAASLGTYLGHDLGEASPEELVELRAVYQTIREGAITWSEALAAKTGVAEEEGEDGANAEILEKIAAVKGRLGGKAAAKQQNATTKAPPKGGGGGKSSRKGKARKAPSKSKAEPKAEPAEAEALEGEIEAVVGAAEEIVANAEPATGSPLTPEQIAEGWDFDEATGELIPPEPGAEG